MMMSTLLRNATALKKNGVKNFLAMRVMEGSY